MMAVRPRTDRGALSGPEPCDLSGELLMFVDLDRGHVGVRQSGARHEGPVDDAGAVLADRTHGDLGMGGQSQLADTQDVERRAQCPCDLGRNRDATARQAEDDDVVAGADPPPECGAEQPPGVAPIGEPHDRTTMTGHGHRWTTRIAVLPSAMREIPERPCVPMRT